MRILILPLIACLLTGCSTTPASRAAETKSQAVIPDQIDALVAKLSSGDMWQNGLFKPVDLPSSATPEEVVSQVDKLTGLYQGGKLTSYRIIETRQVQIGSGITGGRFTAVLLDTNMGKKIVLLQYQGSKTGWWSRAYDQ